MKKIMSILIISMFFLTLLSTISVAQIISKENDKITTLGNEDISCKVIDGKSGIALSGVTVKLYVEGKSTYLKQEKTNLLGECNFNDISSDNTYTIKATKTGYTEGEVNNVEVGDTVEIKIALNGGHIKNSIFPRVFQNNYLSLIQAFLSKI